MTQIPLDSKRYATPAEMFSDNKEFLQSVFDLFASAHGQSIEEFTAHVEAWREANFINVPYDLAVQRSNAMAGVAESIRHMWQSIAPTVAFKAVRELALTEEQLQSAIKPTGNPGLVALDLEAIPLPKNVC